jgi:predicted aspartyl protease
MRRAPLIGLVLIASGAAPLTTAITHRDIVELERRAATATTDEASLARGAALALRHHDDAARALLEPLAAGTATELRAGACFALADIALRQTRYAEAHAALACAEQALNAPLTGEPAQIKADTAALAGEPAMMRVGPTSGALDVQRDSAGLIRVAVTINDQRLKAVIDSDASFSVVSQSTAERLGLRLLPAELAIVTTSRADQPMHLAIADRLQFGDTQLQNVVFAVLPDRAIRFGPNYRMEAVIGLPVLVSLGRIAINHTDDGERLEYGPGGSVCKPNLILSGLDPFVLVPAGGHTLRLALDTAADRTTLNASALHQSALGGAITSATLTWQGAGGSATDRSARVLDEFVLTLGERVVTLHRVAVLSQSDDDRHGLIGLDAFKTARRWSIDFDAMCVAIDA